MNRLTLIKNYPIREGKHQEVVRVLASLAELAQDEAYFHPANPAIGTPLVHERFKGITLRLRIPPTGIAPKDYVPAARVDKMGLHLEYGDVPGYSELHELILARVAPYLANAPPVPASTPPGDNISQRV